VFWWNSNNPGEGNLGKRLLLVEDEPGLVMTLSDLLTAEGYQVETAGDGQTALNLAGQHTFSLILLDVMLPVKNGFDVCRDLRQQGIKTPILMLTARVSLLIKS
jgi:DNA-binding response OmpR family regulator